MKSDNLVLFVRPAVCLLFCILMATPSIGFEGFVFSGRSKICFDGEAARTEAETFRGADVRYTIDGTDPFASETATSWNGTAIVGDPALFRARTCLDGMFNPLLMGARFLMTGNDLESRKGER